MTPSLLRSLRFLGAAPSLAGSPHSTPTSSTSEPARLLLGAASLTSKAQTVKALGQGGQTSKDSCWELCSQGALQPVHFVASIMQPASLSQISEPVHGGSGETSPREGHLGAVELKLRGLLGDPETVDPECVQLSMNLRGERLGAGGGVRGAGGKVLAQGRDTIRFARE